MWWGTDPTRGRRPYLVLSRDAAIDHLRRVIVVPATSTVRTIPTEVELDHSDGMPEECVVSLDNIQAFPRRALSARICELGPERMAQVGNALRIATDC